MIAVITDYFTLAVQSIRNRQLRSWLTMLGIVVGVAAIVSLIALGQGLEMAVTSQFSKLGADFVTVIPGAPSSGFAMGMSSSKLKDDDVRVIEQIPEVDMVAPTMTATKKVVYSNEERYIPVAGIEIEAALKILITKQGFQIVEGRDPRPSDRGRAIVGYKVAKDFFDKNVNDGSDMEIGGEKFKVIGILEQGTPRDRQIMIALEDAKVLFARADYDAMIVVPKTGQNPEDLAAKIKAKLKQHRGEEDFQVYTSKQILERIGSVIGIVQAILVGIAAISLLVGGIGIMNSMYTSVLERTKEIGILKAIGASGNNILALFLIEAGLMGAAGGIIGAIFGIGLGKIVELVAESYLGPNYLKVFFPPELILFAMAFAFTVGCVSGFLPARRAANMDPVIALKGH